MVKCQNLVRSVWYKTTMFGHDERVDSYGIWIQFYQEVVLTSNLFSIEPITLLTRIGGIIGVGKELFWVIISMSGLLLMLRKHIGKWNDNLRLFLTKK